jgi:ferredoxin
MRKIPVIDAVLCTRCDSCLEVCPEVFKENEDLEIIEVLDLPAYPEEDVSRAIHICPADSIRWEEEG